MSTDHDQTPRTPQEHAAPSRRAPAQESVGPVGGFVAAGLQGAPIARGQQTPMQRQLLSLQRAAGNRAVSQMVQRIGSADPTAPDELGSRLDARSGSGEPIAEPVKQRVEQGLGADLSRVRLHTDNEADQLARSVDSVAFATGNDIYLSRSAPSLDTPKGEWLLAHEATHTIQQSSGPVPGTDIGGGINVSNPGDSAERAADVAADRVAAGESGVVGGAASAGSAGAVQRLRPEDAATAGAAAPAQPDQQAGLDAGADPTAESPLATTPAAAATAAPAASGSEAAQASAAPPAPATADTGQAPAPAKEPTADAANATEAGKGPKPVPGKRNPIPAKSEDEMGAAEREQAKQEENEPAQEGGEQEGVQVQRFARRSLQRWTGTEDREGFINLWPTNLQVKMKNAPTVVVGRYNGAWTPRAYFDHEYSWDTHSGPSGHYYVNGNPHANWDAEDEWTDLRAVPKTTLQEPGADSFEPMPNVHSATFTTRPDFHTDEYTASVQENFQTYKSALASRPTAATTEDAFDETNVVSVGESAGGVSSRAAQTITANITQSVQSSVSETATGTFARTTTTSTETSAGLEGSGGRERPGEGGQGKDTLGLKASLGRKWTDTEQEMAQRALASAYTEITTTAQSYTIPFTIPAGVPAACIIVPVTRKVTSSFPRILDVDDEGIVAGNAANTTRVVESNVPKGFAALFGYDTEYVTALGAQYEECRALRQECERLRGAQLEAKKAELRTKITNFSSQHQPSYQRARANAMQQLRAMGPTAGPGAPAMPPAADNVARWHTGIEDFWRFASGATAMPPR